MYDTPKACKSKPYEAIVFALNGILVDPKCSPHAIIPGVSPFIGSAEYIITQRGDGIWTKLTPYMN